MLQEIYCNRLISFRKFKIMIRKEKMNINRTKFKLKQSKLHYIKEEYEDIVTQNGSTCLNF